MAVPNSLPVSLSSVIAEFGGGANAPKNLSAYRAGGGYTPAGTKGGSAAIPTPGGSIPSSLPLNLGAFPGSKKELSVTDYWPYKDFFHRDTNYYASTIPQTYAVTVDNTSTGEWGGLNTYTTNSKYGFHGRKGNAPDTMWQQKVLGDLRNVSSIPDSNKCTVFYFVVAHSALTASVLSGGTGMSVRALDPNGNLMNVTPVATGIQRFNFDSSTDAAFAIAWATFNMSIKKVYSVFTAMIDNADGGSWDRILVLPEVKKLNRWKVNGDDSNNQLKFTPALVQPNEVVFGARWDHGGDGSENVQYTGQTFPSGYCSFSFGGGGHSTNAGGFDLEANTGPSAVTLATPTPQNFGPANMWLAIADNTGVLYATGVNPIWPSLNLSTGSSSVTFLSNGSVSAVLGGAAYDLPNYIACPENWYMGTDMNSIPGNSYAIKAVLTTGSATIGGSGMNVWLPMSSNKIWTYTATGAALVVVTFYFSTDGGATQQTLGSVTFDSVVSSGGGGIGGGGGCVEITSYLPGDLRASEVQVGDELQLADNESLELATGVVSYSVPKVMPGYRFVTETGASLRCSDTAPIPTLNGYRFPSQLLGESVAVRRDIAGECFVSWDRVVSVETIGDIVVQHITVGDKNFWAGEKQGSYILHHNLKGGNEQNAAN